MLTGRGDYTSGATLPHDLVDLIGAAHVVVGKVLDVDAFVLLFMYLQVIVLSCIVEIMYLSTPSAKEYVVDLTHAEEDRGCAQGRSPCKRL